MTPEPLAGRADAARGVTSDIGRRTGLRMAPAERAWTSMRGSRA